MASAQPLSGKVALVTGSSRGIGAAIARRLAADGATVIINYVSSEKAAQEIVNELDAKRPKSAIAIKADVSSAAGAQALFAKALETCGRVDILVLNSGIMKNKALAEVDEAHYDSHFNANVKGPLFLTKAAAPHLTEGLTFVCYCSWRPADPSFLSLGSRIIFFSSSLTRFSMIPANYLIYAGTKGAIEQFARVLAKDLGAKGITVNTVSPGPINTEMFTGDKTEDQIKFFANMHPPKRIGEPTEIANVVAFLAGPDSTWVNGQNIPVNGVNINSVFPLLVLLTDSFVRRDLLSRL